MAQFTERAIIDTFLSLLEEKPLDKITVREIIEKCGISRNTFYYHYGDIYALLEAVFRQDAEKIIQPRGEDDTRIDGLRRLFDYMVEKRRVLYHIYTSMEHQLLERYIFQATEPFFMQYIHEEAQGLPVAEEDLQFLCFSYQSMFAGFLFEWLRRGMRQDLHEVLDRAQRLLLGSTRRILEASMTQRGDGDG